jgi:hypothetical protein
MVEKQIEFIQWNLEPAPNGWYLDVSGEVHTQYRLLKYTLAAAAVGTGPGYDRDHVIIIQDAEDLARGLGRDTPHAEHFAEIFRQIHTARHMAEQAAYDTAR